MKGRLLDKQSDNLKWDKAVDKIWTSSSEWLIWCANITEGPASKLSGWGYKNKEYIPVNFDDLDVHPDLDYVQDFHDCVCKCFPIRSQTGGNSGC